MVPKGWAIKNLSDLADVTSGGTPSRSNPEYWDGDIPWVTTAEIINGVITNTRERITSAGVANSSAKIFPTGTILLAMYGQGKTRGKVARLGIDASTNQACAAILPKVDASGEYLYQNLLSRYEEIRNFSNDGSQKNLSGALVKSIPILVPPLTEQERLGEILFTWDRAIEIIENLIKSSERQKKALMQKLLDNPEWPLVQLSALGDISSAGVDKKTNPDEKPVRLLNYLDVLNRDFIPAEDLTHWVTAADRQITKCDVRRGDIFFTPSSETRDDIAHSAVATEDIPSAAYSYHVVRFRLNEPWDLNYRAYAFKTSHFYRQAYQLCEGSGQRYVLSQRYFRQMTIRVPPITEQREIGSALRTTDEISARYKFLAQALRQEKRALMQQLLTGKRRVHVDDTLESSHA